MTTVLGSAVPSETAVCTTADLVRLCRQLGLDGTGALSAGEKELLLQSPGTVSTELVEATAHQIAQGKDPLGAIYSQIMSPEQRRPRGQTYTPADVITPMIDWSREEPSPVRVVDPGAGSGRYLVAAGTAFPDASLVASEVDPLTALMLRATVTVSGLQHRTTIVVGDYRSLALPPVVGKTLFIGNPPYVRHHDIQPEWKKWLTDTAARRGLKASALAGLHVHFFLATAEHGRPGDYGTFITSSEWLDVNYGSLIRDLLLDGLGGESITVLDPRSAVFDDATTTGVITCFRIGETPAEIRMREVRDKEQLGNLSAGTGVPMQRLREAHRWSGLLRTPPAVPRGYIELGELCRVHRGSVTGANKTWVQRKEDVDLPEQFLLPVVTRAKELFAAGERLTTTDELRRLVALPVDLDEMSASDRKRIEQFLDEARDLNVPDGYIASRRKAWWSVDVSAPAPILATYMARRPPTFVRNDAAARHINIAHGLYPREDLDEATLDNLASFLRRSISLGEGRTYAGGLTKFEPKEMERLRIPDLEQLKTGDF